MSAMPHDSIPEEPPARHGRETTELAERLAALLSGHHDLGKRSSGGEAPRNTSDAGNVRSLGRARKVSVSMPEELTAALQQRVGRGEFSHYVTDAVARQLELDLLAELAELLETEHGPVPEEMLAEARAVWPDVE
ncbi:hypothetical protein [Actinopolyspora halophila]|uniref:hypothetical protein n=1 Tax=Actinopolyspora halophila TaxID=1850 RepID=UPI00035D0178|nr:hypothetical protein [Actinopolyspora halophila]